MKIGASVYPTQPVAGLIELSRGAEELGFESLYFGDSQNIWRESFTVMGAVAASTSDIRIATGVSNLVTRHPAVVAAGFVTLSEFAPDRVIAGFGTGDSSMATLGYRPMKLAQLEEAVGDFRSFTSGDEVVAGDNAARITYAPTASVPVYIAATGAKILRLAGRIADGVIVLAGADPDAITRALEIVDAGALEAGRDPASVVRVLWLPTAIEEDAEVARNLVRSNVARTALRPQPWPLPDDLAPTVELLRSSYDYYQHMSTAAEHAELVPKRLIDRFAVAGDPDGARDQLQRLAGLDISEVICVPFAPTEAQRVDTLRRFADAASHLTPTIT
ncbi:hypothetical protein A8M60_03935 [Nocardia farcinica]|nr:hypothetical protein A8M60_03935 [Nocardia farcinica]